MFFSFRHKLSNLINTHSNFTSCPQ